MPKPTWRRLDRHYVAKPFCLADDNAGNSIAARMAMMAMTTSNSIKVNAAQFDLFCRIQFSIYGGGGIVLVPVLSAEVRCRIHSQS